MSSAFTNKIKSLLPYAVLPLLLVVLLLMLADTTSAPYREVYGVNGVWDLRDFDFENYNAVLVGEMIYIPYALLTPEEFAARSGEKNIGNVGDTNEAGFLTSRDIILLPDDGWFTFTRNSITYAQRQYVNGVWLSNTGRGTPGDNRRNETPDTGRIIFTARPVDGAGSSLNGELLPHATGIIELVQQSSNFVHRQGNRHWAWRGSKSTGLIYESRAMDFRQGIVMGSFFLMFLLFVMLFFMMRRIRATLYFSLFCFMWFLRVGVMGGFTVLEPWIPWVVKIRIEYISSPVAVILTFAIIDVLFPKTLNKTVIWVHYVVSAALIAVYMFIDTVIMTQIGLATYIILGLGVVYVPVMFALKVRNASAEQRIFITGMGLFLFAAVSDIVFFSLYNFDISIVPFQITGTAFLVFALCMAAAVFVAAMKEVETAKESERRLAEENATLDSLNRMKTVYTTNLSHETKTPLTVVSVHVQKALHRYTKNNGNDKQIVESLKRAQEVIMRMSRMAENALKMSSLQETGGDAKILDVTEIIEISAEANRSFIEKRGNAFIVNIEKNLPSIIGKADEIIQVVLNILTNANNHTQNGKISLNARISNANVTVTIADNGTGIPAELLPFVFGRGVSGAGGTGFGLPICKDIIESHGGFIEIKSKAGKGTTVTFTLPGLNGRATSEAATSRMQ